MISLVSWFHSFTNEFRGFIALRFHGFRGFMSLAISRVSWFHGFQEFPGFTSFVLSRVSYFHEFCGFMGFVVPWVS